MAVENPSRETYNGNGTSGMKNELWGYDMSQYLNITIKDGIALVVFNRPEALNALNTAVLKELDSFLGTVAHDRSIQVVILTGEGKSFIAGADISEMAELDARGGMHFGAFGQKVFRKLETLSKPTIAAVNGFALGGGCELAMSCDIRVASEAAVFGQPEVGLGIIPGFSGTQRLPKLVGVAKAKELIMTGDKVKADEALKLGLVNHVVPAGELMEKAEGIARKIMKNAGVAVRLAKKAIDEGYGKDIETGNHLEAGYFGICFSTHDQKHGMEAFMKKEKPSFKNE